MEIAGRYAQECPVCSTMWAMEQDSHHPRAWRFDAHPLRVINSPCPGERCTVDEAWQIVRELDGQ